MYNNDKNNKKILSIMGIFVAFAFGNLNCLINPVQNSVSTQYNATCSFRKIHKFICKVARNEAEFQEFVKNQSFKSEELNKYLLEFQTSEGLSDYPNFKKDLVKLLLAFKNSESFMVAELLRTERSDLMKKLPFKDEKLSSEQLINFIEGAEDFIEAKNFFMFILIRENSLSKEINKELKLINLKQKLLLELGDVLICGLSSLSESSLEEARRCQEVNEKYNQVKKDLDMSKLRLRELQKKLAESKEAIF